MLIAVNAITVDPRNSNVMPQGMYEKLVRNIARTKQYPPLIVRPHGRKEGIYVIVDGHHRYRALCELGYAEVNCDVWNLSPAEQKIALATLNKLHGEENVEKRAMLVADLATKFSVKELELILPESSKQIEKMVAMMGAGAAAQAAANAAATKETPNDIVFKLYADQYVVVRNAIERMKKRLDPDAKNPDGAALEYVCAEWMESDVADEAAEAANSTLEPIGATRAN